MKNSVTRSLKALTLSAFFAAMFLVGCEQPVSSVISSEDVAASYSNDGILGEEPRGDKPGNDFGGIFAKLNLTVEQRAAIDVLAKQRRDCEKAAMDALKASESTIAADFKVQRQAIEAAVKAGTKTREQARTEIRALEAAQKEAMAPARATAEAALKACRDTFIAGVKVLLNEQQLAAFNAWLANPTNGGGKGDDKGGKGKDKGGIFKKLNLTADQQAQIDILIQAHRDCETPILTALKAAEQTIAEPFNAERATIKAALEAGTITREAAQTQMRDVDARQKAAMATVQAEAQANLKACRDTFNAAVREKLTDEQKVIWDDYIAHQPADKPVGDDDKIGDDKTGHHDKGGRGHGRGHR